MTRLNFFGQRYKDAKHVKPTKIFVLLKLLLDKLNSEREKPNKVLNWERMIKIPIPEVKPEMTGYDTKVKYLPNLKKPNEI